MRILGFDVTRAKAQSLQTPRGWTGGAWWSVVREPFTGAWQLNKTASSRELLTSFHAVYSCVSLIAADVAKCRIKLVERGSDRVWTEVSVPAFSPVLRKPNHYQNRIQFFEQWILSKLLRGNTYVLKERDERRVVVGLYVLDPERCKPLIADNGDVYYEIRRDPLSGVMEETVTVPATEIIHDMMTPLCHPLVGVTPLTASGLAAINGLRIQEHSATFFQRGARPSGVLSAPETISDETAKRLKEHFEANFTGDNQGRIAVLGDGLKYEPMGMTSVDAQLIEQLQWSAEVVASVFHVPAYKIGVGEMPKYDNIEALNQQYYSQCLQKLFEDAELLLDEGLGLVDVKGHEYGTEFDLEGLLRMDTATLVKTEGEAVKAGIKSPNEARLQLNYPPVAGGDTPYLQQQNYSLEALDKRDSSDDPFSSGSKQDAPAEPSSQDAPAEPPPEQQALREIFEKTLLRTVT